MTRKLSYDEHEAACKAMKTNPPTHPIGLDLNDPAPDYDEGVEVQWVCPCGCREFFVYYEHGAYRTYVRCKACNKQDDVHTG